MNDNTQIIPSTSPESEIREVDGKEWVFYGGEQICELGRKKALDEVWVHPEPGYIHGRCKMMKRDGERCKNHVRASWTVCWYHGAGRPDKPGGISDWHIAQGRFGKHLPARLLEAFEDFATSPEVLNMTEELALFDIRMADLLNRLENADVIAAWSKVRRAYKILDRDEITEEQYERALELLSSAITAKRDDVAAWKEITQLIESRRKLADTERKRVVDAQQTMTYMEANRLVAFLMNTVMNRVSDPSVKRAIADDMKKVML